MNYRTEIANLALLTLTLAAACGDTSDGGADGGGDEGLAFEAVAEDFECLQNWTKVGSYYLTNKRGMLDEAVAVAENPDGGEFPVGTIIQLVPIEAMVKREKGFSPETGDWEFFFLNASADGTEIGARGTTEVENQFGGNCFDCHAKAADNWDFICATGHGCDPLPLTPQLITGLQEADARCP